MKDLTMIRNAVLLCALALSQVATAAGLAVSDAWIRWLPGDAPAGGYFLLRNDGPKAVKLVGAESPAFGHVMMHRSVEVNGVNRMRHVAAVEVPAGGSIAFAPGGYHLMLMDASGRLAIGDQVAVTLEFSDGRRFTADFVVRGPAGN